ncbi:hypothetical protein [Herbiconiux sp. L3-i23]|uniref:hypothetical protein n=1 Tax=Herbiconiux sp. L3-i23 TaxID=2905871 RepID=UPI00206D8E5C|nr:hypothetical protein [Herbiconiux sp. L3-i23]BDI24046.1 hypothetical protein L3i23_28220 [Herbiconiux sp. L3-i23]
MGDTAAEQTGSDAELRAERLKERVYITFTALAVVLALRSHADELTAGSAALTLVISVVGALLAILVADFVSHLVAHGSLPSAGEVRHMLQVAFGALGAAVLPLIFMALAGFDIWTVDGALRASSIALITTLGVGGFLAVRRVRIPGWQKLLVLGVEVALGVLVVALELLAHG